jgi:ABC-type Na+ efflux pump permease subunit
MARWKKVLVEILIILAGMGIMFLIFGSIPADVAVGYTLFVIAFGHIASSINRVPHPEWEEKKDE